MRLFQNSGLSVAYRARMGLVARGTSRFAERLAAFVADRYGASHLLLPVLAGWKNAFLTNSDDETLQRLWANEQGMPSTSTQEDILLAQIEAHRAEVFYNLDPMRWQTPFLKRLPGTVRKKICWRAAPSPGADFSAYDAVVCNFPSIVEEWRTMGWRAAIFYPAHDPVMDNFAGIEDRSIDVLFVGTYSRHHRNRIGVLDAVARLSPRFNVRFCLDRSRLTRISETPLGLLGPLAKHRRPDPIRAVSSNPVFGLDLYRAIGQSKIVLNGAIDMAGSDRGNMRCFESMGCGALMVSDVGDYPPGMLDGETMLTYRTLDEALQLIVQALGNWPAFSPIARNGHRLVSQKYSKSAQWDAFERLVESL